MNEHIAPLLAEIERGLQSRLGTLSQAEIEAQLAAVRAVFNGSDRDALIALRQLGLDVIRLLNARLRQEMELRDPRRERPGEGTTVH